MLTLLSFLAWTLCALLCMGGLLLSALSISGTWLVLAAAVLASFLVPPGHPPGGPTLLAMALACASVDVLEWFAASWGVRRRGGSRAAGWLALLGSLGGMIVGTLFLPVPLVGGFIGMVAGSFALVYWHENRRLRHSGQARRVAAGAVLAAISMLLLKVAATAALVAWLAWSLLANAPS